jgi:serine protease AprX
MKNYIRPVLLSILFFLAGEISLAQSSNTRYWVAFTDKNASPYSVGNPQQFLSQRAINRRALHGYPVTTQDLPVNPSYVTQVKATGAVLVSRSRWFNGVIVRITNPSQLTAINALPFVQSTKSVALIRPQPLYVGPRENPPVMAKQASPQAVDRFDYGQGYGQINQLNGICLHNQYFDGAGMQIAELDNGFMNANNISAFDSLFMQNRMIGKFNFFKGDTSETYTLGGHGTSVLSCMAAFKPGTFIGTAPYASYYLLRSEVDTCEQIIEEYSWVSAVEYADSAGADIATSSLGYIGFDDATQDHTWADLDGKTSIASRSATLAARRGMIVCVAAGNAGTSGWRKITIPSDADSILCVGAVDNGGSYAAFSSQGYSADGRVKPDVMAQGLGTTVISTGGTEITSNGTSFATPVLAGMVACLWQANPTKKNMEVIAAIRQSASQYASPDSLMGYGIPDFCLANQILKSTGGLADNVELQFTGNGLTVSGLNDCTLSVDLYDVTGRLLESASASVRYGQRTTISLAAYDAAPAGVYLVKITSDKGYKSARKLAKQ